MSGTGQEIDSSADNRCKPARQGSSGKK